MPVTYVDKIYYNNSQYSRGYMGSELLWDKKPDFFYIENLYNGLNTLTLKKTGSPTTGSDIQWSGDIVTWTPVTYDANNEFLIGIPNQNQKIYFRSSTGFSSDVDNYFTFTASEIHSVGGDARTLIDYTNSSLNTAVASCLRSLFDGDTELTDASSLDLTKIAILATSCYRKMFNGCTSLTQVPVLPATTLTNYCYFSMFNGCSSLTAAPSLNATTLAKSCYYQMFQGCTSLVNAPSLPATTLAEGCYYQMFSGCTSLVQAPDLPATTLATECYRFMFNGCTSLTQAPKELPATASAESCYRAMFQNCSALEFSPDIYCSPDSATAFSYMFSGCTSLREIRIHSTTWDTTNTAYWVANVAASGWLYNFAQITTIPTGNDGIPTGWSWIGEDYFYIENRTSGTNTISISRTNQGYDTSRIYYFRLGGTATRVTYSSNRWTINLSSIGERVYFFCDNGFSNSNCKYIFSGTANHSAGGDLRTMINSTNRSLDTVPAYAFYSLFEGDTTLVDISRLDFSKLTTLGSNCYAWMFYRCTSLASVPSDMLPATTLAQSCYLRMFSICTSLTQAPDLPATTLAQDCYDFMFDGSSNLNKVTVYATTWSTYSADSWLNNVAASGDFYNIGGATIPTNNASGIPSGWTEHTSL